MSSWAAKSLRPSELRVSRPALYQLVAPHTSHSRSIWRCARNYQGEDIERVSQRVNKYQQIPLPNRPKTEALNSGSATPNQRHSNWSWGVWRSRSRYSDPSAGRGKTSWDADSHKRFEALKKYIEADPYGAIFGRRLDPFNKFGKCDTPWNGFLQPTPKKARAMRTKSRDMDNRQTRNDANHIGLEYDPITGRMAPMAPAASPKPSEEANFDPRIGVDYPSGSQVEAKLTANSNPLDDGHHQPEVSKSSTISQLGSNSTAEDLPGDESDVVSPSTPPTSSGDDTRKPISNIDCSPKIECDSLSIPESATSAQFKPDLSKDFNTDKKVNSDVECVPESELDTKFNSDPFIHSGESLPSKPNTEQPDLSPRIAVDCPPGNELEANLTAVLASQDTKPEIPVQADINPEHTKPQESFDCSPGSELEAQVLSESFSKGNGESTANIFKDCSPGSELEAKFKSNAVLTEDGRFQSETTPGLDAAKTSNINIDCPSGNELEAVLIADSVSTNGSNAKKDISISDDGEPHARCDLSRPKEQHGPLDEDRVGDFITRSQMPTTETRVESSASQQRFPEFHILAFDASTSQVLTSEADSFFGVNEDIRPSEILSRLHHPAKFLPYFKRMQDDDYEIATGGGNLLVFRKVRSNPLLNPQTAEQDPAIRAEISKHIGHNLKSFTSPHERNSGKYTLEPHPPPESSTFGPEPNVKPESPFLNAVRRMLFAGTATAAICYAIGVVVEFFRTGGKDGRGADGFTVFESDRRR